MKLYLVTGGAGFIGSHLADELLASGHRVRILDDLSTGRLENVHPDCELIRGDIRDVETVHNAMSGVDGCFHLAAIASVVRANEDWIGTHQVNLSGTINVFDAARAAPTVPVVYASSAAVYGRTSGIAFEAGPTAPLTAYGADKRACELHALAGATVHGLKTLGFRFFNVYGPRQDPASPYSGVISIFARTAAIGRPITINGSGKQTRDFVFVRDIVRFLVTGMDTLERNSSPALQPGLVLNACTGRETSIAELAAMLQSLAGSGGGLRFGPARPGDIERSVGSPELAKQILGVTGRTPLLEGLKHTLAELPDRTLLPA